MKRRTEMREALLKLAHEAAEDAKEEKYKKYTRRPLPCMPGFQDVPDWTHDKWIDEEFERMFIPRKSFLHRLFGL